MRHRTRFKAVKRSDELKFSYILCFCVLLRFITGHSILIAQFKNEGVNNIFSVNIKIGSIQREETSFA